MFLRYLYCKPLQPWFLSSAVWMSSAWEQDDKMAEKKKRCAITVAPTIASNFHALHLVPQLHQRIYHLIQLSYFIWIAKNLFTETLIFAIIWSLYPLLELQTPETWGFGRMCNPARRWEEETNFISTSCSNQPLPLFLIILFLKATLTRSRNTYLGQVFFRPRLSETKRYMPFLDHFSGKKSDRKEKASFHLGMHCFSLTCMYA